MPKGSKPQFEVHPSVVYQLGESLISDSVQALIELVKNCYDADASFAKVTIDTNGDTAIPNSIHQHAGGVIVVEDDGHGMSLGDIESGWLTISNRRKLQLKKSKGTTPGQRTPLGDKGLGRLGVQRLGENLEIFTKTQKDKGYHFGFSWRDFGAAHRLQDVDIHLVELEYPRKHGTKVVVSALHDTDTWRGQDAVKRLEHELSRMISPYKEIRDFTVLVEVDGKPLELLEVSDKVRDLAPVHYDINFDGNILTVKGRARLSFFRPDNSNEAELFSAIAESDGGDAFYEYLNSRRIATSINLSRPRSKKWFVEFEWQRPIANIDKVERDQRKGVIANPGPFTGEVDSFSLGRHAFREQSIFDRLQEYRSHIKKLSGVRVYRDGFAIRVDHDWLELGGQWTSASSYYGLKPDNTLGYIALSARDNIDLEETTDREGFKDTSYYRNFYALLTDFKEFTERSHEFFRRAWSDFKAKRNEERAQIDSRKTVEDISHSIKNSLAGAKDHHQTLNTLRERLHGSAQRARSVLSELSSAEDVTAELRSEVTSVLSTLEPLISESQQVITQLSVYLEELHKIQGMGQVLDDRVNAIRRQMDEMYETVALGLTAEALSHEVFNITDQMAKRTKSARTRLRGNNSTDRVILNFVEYVNSSIASLRKQVSFLSPSLRYVREQRHEIDVSEYLEELAEFYKVRFKANSLSLCVRHKSGEPFTIRMNKGKLTQIVDNFVLNSEYWLKESMSRGYCKDGQLVFEIDRPFVRIFDNGRGVDPSVEHVLFEPFISSKKRGRGLGLFIAKQLLDADGCTVALLPERNKNKRLFKFQIDLRGGIP